jgi:hypothetical protein
VNGLVEQLRYTWTPRGVEGANRFQIAAMSEGFKSGEMAPLLSMVRSLCRYDPPKGDPENPPVSFGWLDHESHRFAFRRIHLPPRKGKRGNFAAHVLVGTPRSLPEAALASSFGSSFWWDGLTPEDLEEIAAGKRDFQLPAVDFSEVVVARPMLDDRDPEAVMSLVHGLLTLPPDTRLAVAADGEKLGQIVRSVAWRVPEALDGLSLSTYEGSAFFPFRVIGAAAPDAAIRQCALGLSEGLEKSSRVTLERLVSGEPGDRPLRALAGDEAFSSADERRAVLWDRALRVVGLTTGEGAFDRASADLVADPSVVSLLVRTERGRANLAAAAQVGTPAVLRAIGTACGRMEPASHDALCLAIGGRYATTAKLAGCAAVAAVLVDGPAREAMLDGILNTGLGDEDAARGLGPEDAALILGRAAHGGAEAGAIAGLLRATSRQIARCSREKDLPDSYLASMFVALLSSEGATGVLSKAIDARPALLDEIQLDGAEKYRCLELLERLGRAGRETALPGLLPVLAEAPWADRARAVLESLPAAAAGQCVAGALGKIDRDPIPPELSAICDDLAAVLLGQGDMPLALTLLGRSGSADGELALRLSRDLAGGSGGAATGAAMRAARIRHDGLRVAITGIALDRAVGAVEHPADAAEIWRALVRLEPRASTEETLDRLLRRASRQRGGRGGAALLGWIAQSVLSANPKLVKRSGRLRDSDLDALALEVSALVPERLMRGMDTYVEDADTRAVSWWERLGPEKKKGLGRR